MSAATATPSGADQAALVALTTAILSGRDLEAVLDRILSTEEVPDVEMAFRDRSRVRKAAKLAASLLPVTRPVHGQGFAIAWVRRTAPARRAAYVLASSRRLAVPEPDLVRERRYLAQHVAAERARIAAAGQVDAMVLRHGKVLGWRAILDGATTPECRAAAGSNFLAARPPVIGGSPAYPGTLHGGTCRCVASAPFPGGRLLA